MGYQNGRKILEILLVENSQSDAYWTQETLAESNVPHRLHPHRLHIVKDGVEAIDFLYQRNQYTNVPRPDLMLLDLNLPRKNGQEVLTLMKLDETLQSIPVVVMSTSTREEDRNKINQLQALSYLIKPIELRQFMDVVKLIVPVN
jgi:two-component system, chemotaxis family, response regulator Rcp1